MNISPGDTFSITYTSRALGGFPSHTESYWVDSVEPSDDPSKVAVQARRIHRFDMKNNGGLKVEVIKGVELAHKFGITYMNYYRVNAYPKNWVHAEPLTLIEDVDGVITVVDRFATVTMGAGITTHTSDDISMWAEGEHVNEDALREDMWFHASTRENWEDEALEACNPNGQPLLIHAGSREAAMGRMGYKVDPGQEFFLYSLRIRKEAVIYDEVVGDQEDEWNMYHTAAMLGNDIFAYENSWEDAGSISVCGRLAVFEVVGAETLVLPEPSGTEQAKSNNRSRLVVTTV